MHGHQSQLVSQDSILVSRRPVCASAVRSLVPGAVPPGRRQACGRRLL
ncbi:hypothetical protein SGM_6802 [Streptomyces griseoaurantiacus M045]|uniref:Uncharacterized protein n=1 Tax=Streptomyces griseoaurantiacus M045 TaxID=996637 RepID=F3NCB3_9ACTN|nr:hypothetical protein SGM_6802 [Streptomyces griseoaurantiacus M045]